MPTSAELKRGVGKPAFACGPCERAKRKCDGDRPCGRCRQLGKECVDSPASAKRRQREGKIEAPVGGSGKSGRQRAPKSKMADLAAAASQEKGMPTAPKSMQSPSKQRAGPPPAPTHAHTTVHSGYPQAQLYPDVIQPEPTSAPQRPGSRPVDRWGYFGANHLPMYSNTGATHGSAQFSHPPTGGAFGVSVPQAADARLVDSAKHDIQREHMMLMPSSSKNQQSSQAQTMPSFTNSGHVWQTEGGGGIFVPDHRFSNPQPPSNSNLDQYVVQSGKIGKLLGAAEKSEELDRWRMGENSRSLGDYDMIDNGSSNMAASDSAARTFFHKSGSSSNNSVGILSLQESLHEIESSSAPGAVVDTPVDSSNSFMENFGAQSNGWGSPEGEIQLLSSLSADMSYEDVENELHRADWLPSDYSVVGGKRARSAMLRHGSSSSEYLEHPQYSFKKKRQAQNDSTLGPMLAMQGVEITDPQWLGFGVMLEDLVPCRSIESMDIKQTHKEHALGRVPANISKAVNIENMHRSVNALYVQVKMHNLSERQWMQENVMAFPVDCLTSVARSLRKMFPGKCPNVSKSVIRQESSLSTGGLTASEELSEKHDKEREKEAVGIIQNCLPEIVRTFSYHELMEEILIQRVLLQIETPVVRIHYTKHVCIPTCVFFNRAASLFFGINESSSEFNFVPGGGFGLQIAPADLVPHLVARARACANGQKQFSVKARFLKDLSTFTGLQDPIQKSVVEATYTAHMEYFPDSKEVECITYVLQNPADTGDFYAVSQEQLLEEYKLAVRRGILSLWQHSELSQVLKASNATSLAEALTSQIVPKRQ
eukprot:gb/GECG01012599.1/.p1 GENE.gb/GECG01012599.1/~~gb/GECG01012599.1/.p1  ORF type:complete len:823 (+),score=93.63 gb/GECG01012599.1/:1-2469(+)